MDLSCCFHLEGLSFLSQGTTILYLCQFENQHRMARLRLLTFISYSEVEASEFQYLITSISNLCSLTFFWTFLWFFMFGIFILLYPNLGRSLLSSIYCALSFQELTVRLACASDLLYLILDPHCCLLHENGTFSYLFSLCLTSSIFPVMHL